MLDVGFLPAIRRIVAILPKHRRTMCFSATMEGKVLDLVKDYMKSPVRVAFGSTLKPPASVRLQAFEVIPERKPEVLRRLLAKETGRCLVFARTKRGADRLAKALNRDGFTAAAYLSRGLVSEFAFAAAVTGRAEPVGTWCPLLKPQRDHFSFLCNHIEVMFRTGKPSYPVERTYLVTGVLAALIDSHAAGGKRLETPHLHSVGYTPTATVS